MTQINICTSNSVSFKSLKNGEIFIAYDLLYIKLDRVVNRSNCVNLSNGSLEQIEPNASVTHVTEITAKSQV